MKITAVTPILAKLDTERPYPDRTWTFVVVETDEGISGVGESSSWPGDASRAVGGLLAGAADILVGDDPFESDRIWHKLYRRFTYAGSRGMVTAAISGIDIALWDIKGKALGKPVHALLGGTLRDNVPLYANGWFVGCTAPEDYAQAARETVDKGYGAIKLDPFTEMLPYHTGYVSGTISPEGEQLGIDKVAAIREAVGPNVDVLIDAHGHYNVPTAIRIGNRLAEYDVAWYEEPVPPESYEALAQVRENVAVPICVGERLFTRYDFVPIFENRLADYIMPDVVWTGGITELRKIAAMAEAYYVPISPHNVSSAVQVVASCHAMIGVPNFYRQEFAVQVTGTYNPILAEPLDVRDGALYLPDKPGLGIELDLDYLKGHPDPRWERI